MTQKYTEAKKKANKKWDEKNKERTKYINSHSQARVFIRRYATIDDIEELRRLLNDKENELK
ncbi:hypothetical protein [Companilactobacillus keshanensis]|uniref:Phage protein n=1 Tax=Companilactobacillus keshanensis TaxID=2486003 RepID=A0ABW4BV00_9LACO|nr:hypothetical protein [Companilactobacillus keshanensis]